MPMGAEGVGSEEGVFPSPVGEGMRRGVCPCPENFFIFCLAMVHFGPFLNTCFNISTRRVKVKTELKSNFVCHCIKEKRNGIPV